MERANGGVIGADTEGKRYSFINIEGNRRLATVNLVPGSQVYGEKLVRVEGVEYRTWDPFRSKLAAALLKDLQDPKIKVGNRILYLGTSTGTTASHLSDLVGHSGVIFGVEFAHRVAREFVERVVKSRGNIVPIVEDARQPEKYIHLVEQVDAVYSDIAQADQTDIAISNCRTYLRKGGCLLLVVKSRSIDVTKSPRSLFLTEAKKLTESGFDVKQTVELTPFDKDHALVSAIWKG